MSDDELLEDLEKSLDWSPEQDKAAIFEMLLDYYADMQYSLEIMANDFREKSEEILAAALDETREPSPRDNALASAVSGGVVTLGAFAEIFNEHSAKIHKFMKSMKEEDVRTIFKDTNVVPSFIKDKDKNGE